MLQQIGLGIAQACEVLGHQRFGIGREQVQMGTHFGNQLRKVAFLHQQIIKTRGRVAPQKGRTVTLLIKVNQEHAPPFKRQSRGNVDGSSGFARAAFIRRYGQDVWFWHMAHFTTSMGCTSSCTRPRVRPRD